MPVTLLQFAFFLLLGMAIILLFSIKYRIPAFYSLMIAALVVGLGLQLPAADVISQMKEGFGNIMKSLGFIIVLGTALGLLLGFTGSSAVMARFILRIVGEKNAALGISMTGFIVGMPVFCDSGYIVLNELNKSLSKRSNTPIVITSVSLATGLLSVHCLIPPHPGAAAAAATLGVDYGKLMIMGLIVAVPAMLTGWIWAKFAGRKGMDHQDVVEEKTIAKNDGPPVIKSFLPVFVPIALIAFKSFLTIEKAGAGFLIQALSFLGDPIIALSVGILLAFSNKRHWKKEDIHFLLSESAEKAGSILVIIGAGGAFGAILSAGQIGTHFSHAFPLSGMSLFFPFLLTVILKTAQGSSTVAIITASSIMLPLLPALHMESESGKVLCVLAMGAGSMVISHANDAYFWVISKFSGIEMKPMLRVYTLATGLMGLVAFFTVWILSLFM